jgi:hypothetical protein
MNFKSSFFSQDHFHIRWSTASALDWEPFSSRAEAEKAAKRLARPHESYRIEERRGSCGRCAMFWHEKVSRPSTGVRVPYAKGSVAQIC